MQQAADGLVPTLMSLPLFHAEWVLWLLMGLSVASFAAMVERWWFYRKHSIDLDTVRAKLSTSLKEGDLEGAAEYLQGYDSIETNVVLFGLRDCQDGPDSVEDLISGAFRHERARYEKRLGLLATIAANAPFIGLFGTVLGIIRAFHDLAGNMAEANSSVMAGIAEALVATAVGLLVAIPAVVAFNVFKSKVNQFSNNAHLLLRTLLARLKAKPVPTLFVGQGDA